MNQLSWLVCWHRPPVLTDSINLCFHFPWSCDARNMWTFLCRCQSNTISARGHSRCRFQELFTPKTCSPQTRTLLTCRRIVFHRPTSTRNNVLWYELSLTRLIYLSSYFIPWYLNTLKLFIFILILFIHHNYSYNYSIFFYQNILL